MPDANPNVAALDRQIAACLAHMERTPADLGAALDLDTLLDQLAATLQLIAILDPDPRRRL